MVGLTGSRTSLPSSSTGVTDGDADLFPVFLSYLLAWFHGAPEQRRAKCFCEGGIRFTVLPQ
jgi:hypothetical protein